MSLTNIIVFLTSTVSIFLGFFVILKNKKDLRNIYLGFFVFSLAGWGVSMALLVITTNVLWGRLTFLFTALAYIFYVLFIARFLNSTLKINIFIKNFFLILGVAIVLIAPTDLIIVKTVRNEISSSYGGVDVVLGGLYLFVVLYYVVTFIYLAILMIRGYQKSSGIYKSQMKFFFFGIIIFTIAALTTNLILPLLNIFYFNGYGPVFSVVMIASMVYAITRYRFMDIKAIIKKSSVFTILVIIIGSIFIFLSNIITYGVEIILKGNDYAGIISSVIISIIIATIFQPLRKFIEKITDRFLFIKSYNSDDLLTQVNQTTSSIIDLDKLLRLIAKDVYSAFHYSKIGVALIDGQGRQQQLKIFYQSGFIENELEKFSKNKVKFLPLYFRDSKEIKVIDELKARYDANEYQPKSKDLLFGLYELNISLVIPLFTKEKLVGVIVLGNKKSDDLYNNDDLRTLNIIAGQLGIAIENARLYEEQKKFNIHLKKEIERATEKLAAANKELMRLDDAKSEFLSIASHQLRTPSTAVKGYVSMILEGNFGKISKSVKESLEKVYLANERLLNLVESLLNISRIEAGREDLDIQPVDMAGVAKPIIDDFKIKIKEKKLKLSFEVEPGLPKALGDAGKIKEIISNIIDNSMKYTNEGDIMVNLHQESQSVVFACQDTGIGIEPDDLPRLFNKFVRGKGMMQVHTEGTGLGMYYARILVESMGGRIWAESPGKNRGAKFSFSLPMADKSQARKVGK